MNEFDNKAQMWDKEKMHFERSQAIADDMIKMFPQSPTMCALEYGAGTGILSFMLKDHFKYITMMDSSSEMVAVMNTKIAETKAHNLKAVFHDLESKPYDGQYDIIYCQMVLHHVVAIENLFDEFKSILKPNGYLVIADLYTEDGSFHGEGFTGHHGFEIQSLSNWLMNKDFKTGMHKKCYIIKRPNETGGITEYPVFLLVAQL